jgi:hypothetical protein
MAVSVRWPTGVLTCSHTASNLGKRVSNVYRLNVAQEENRSERATLLDPDIILDDDRIAIVILVDPLRVSRSRETPAQDL